MLAEAERSHFGLPSVSERLQFYGGRATIETHPGAGTRVTLFLPQAQSSVEAEE
jgi:signal transduction histidine kinase